MPGNASGDNYIGSFCADQNVIIGANLAGLDYDMHKYTVLELSQKEYGFFWHQNSMY